MVINRGAVFVFCRIDRNTVNGKQLFGRKKKINRRKMSIYGILVFLLEEINMNFTGKVATFLCLLNIIRHILRILLANLVFAVKFSGRLLIKCSESLVHFFFFFYKYWEPFCFNLLHIVGEASISYIQIKILTLMY